MIIDNKCRLKFTTKLNEHNFKKFNSFMKYFYFFYL